MRGFTFIEVLLYIGLFSLLGTALFVFSWDIIDLSEKSHTEQSLVEEARFSLEKMKSVLRNSTGIDEENSVFDSVDGKLIVHIRGSSDTITFENENDRVVMRQSGDTSIALHSGAFRVRELIFEKYKALGQPASFVSITLTLETRENASAQYTAETSLKTGVYLRNFGL